MAEKQVDREAEAPAQDAKQKGAGGRRIQVRRSGVHGKGVFALQPIRKGETIIEYVGEIITWKEADRRRSSDPDDPNHTFFFSIGDGSKVMDANVGGNASRWINHSCAPNCEAEEDDDTFRVFFLVFCFFRAGEELNYDYGLVIDEKHTKALKAQYRCLCGAKQCRGTLLAPKDEPKKNKKRKK